MITTSSAWKEYIKDSSVFHVKATMTGGSTLQLTDSDFMMGSVSFTDSMSGMNEIALGAVVTNTFNATLNNNDGKFDNWDWTEIEVWFGIEVNGNEEWIKRGKYTIDRPSSIGNTIKVECYDYMDKLNTYYSSVTTITYPLEASKLIYYMCQYCGVDYDFAGTTGWQFDTSFNVGTAFADLNDEATTCRQVLSWILQTMGGYARINPSNGKLECKAWNRSQWSPADEITGGIFDVWNAVATTEGGSMNPWSVVADSNGGTYFDGDGAYALEKIKQQTIMIDDITVTGIRAFTYNTVDEFDFATAGSGGYILAIQDNPLVGSGSGSDKQTIADRVWANVQGLSVRPFNASMFGDPSIEAGDTIILRDAKDNYYVSIITNLTFSLGNDMRVSCDAETAETNQLQTANPTTSAIKGAVTASYDYIIAKKISADHIDAGTITAAVTATNFTMGGGKIQISTDDGENDVITLNYNGRKTTLSPYSIKRYYNNDICYFLGSESGNTNAGYLELYANQIKKIVLGATQGRVWLKDANGVNRIYMEADSGAIVVRDASDISRIFMDSASGSIVMRDASNTSRIFMDSTNNSSYFQGRLAIGGNTYYTGYALSLFGSAYASGSWNQGSLEELKDDIKTPDIDPIDVLNNTDIYQFVYKSDKENGLNNVVYGAIIGDGYNCDEHLMSANKDSISPYSMTSILWMIVQNQQKQIESLEKRVAELESINEKKEK